MTREQPGAILVVDDNPGTLYATSRVLRHAGFSVLQAATGTAGIVLASEAPIDLVVLDIDLPDVDGYEVCRRIRSMPTMRRVRVVYLSASFIDDTHKVEGFEAGADGFLSHPVEPAVLIATVGALIRTRDIEMELETLLERERMAREEAERANRAKDDFLATLSHELRSPLTAIVGWADVARLQAAAYPEILRSVDIIARNGRLQAQLISDLLDVSRIATGNMRVEMAPMSLLEVVQTSVETVAGSARERDITLDVELDASVGMVNGDAGRLHQIVSNVVSNAIKFSDNGSVVRVRMVRLPDDVAELTVEDSGRGIGLEMLPFVFDRFWQEDTTSRRHHGGLGLGLSIVKHFTERHGGTVDAASDGEGKGARFTIQLPMLPTDAPMPEPTQPLDEMDDSGEHAILTGVRILLVDDERDGREWVRHIIVEAGAEVMEVDNVELALASVTSYAPHVVVSDLAMPKRNGIDFVTDVRNAGTKGDALPFVALSAFASAEDRQRALDAGFQFFLSKPPDPVELLRTVRRAVRMREKA